MSLKDLQDALRAAKAFRDRASRELWEASFEDASAAGSVSAVKDRLDNAIRNGDHQGVADASRALEKALRRRERAISDLKAKQSKLRDFDEQVKGLTKEIRDLREAAAGLSGLVGFAPSHGSFPFGGLGGGAGASDMLGGFGGGGGGGRVVDYSSGVTGGGGGAASSSSGSGGPSGEWRGLNGEYLGSGSNPSSGNSSGTDTSAHEGQHGHEGQHAETPSGADGSGQQARAPATRERHPSNQSTQTESGGRKPGAKTNNPMNESGGLTGNAMIDAAILRQARFYAGFISMPTGPALALTPDRETGGRDTTGEIDWSMLDPVGPVSYVEGAGPPRASGGRRLSFQNPYIEALYPDGGTSGNDDEDDETVRMVDRFVGQPVTVPQNPTDPEASGVPMGGMLVAYSAGVTSPTIEFDAAGRVRRVTR